MTREDLYLYLSDRLRSLDTEREALSAMLEVLATGGEDTQTGGEDTQTGGGTIPTPPIGGTTVAVNEIDLRDKAMALRGTGQSAVLGIKDGHFGPLSLGGLDIGGGAQLFIVAENRRQAVFERIDVVSGSKNLVFQGLAVCPRGVPTLSTGGSKTYGFVVDASCEDVAILDHLSRGSLDSANHPYWDLATWRTYALGAIFMQGKRGVIRGCYAEGVNFGFNITGDGGALQQSYVYGASGDGCRLAADGLLVEDVLVTDLVYKRDGNHPDAAQAFKNIGGSNVRGIYDLTMRRFAAIEWTVRYDNPLRVAVDANNDQMKTPGIMQGIGFHATGHRNHTLEDIYIRTAVRNGVHYGSVDGLVGRRWSVLSGDYAVRADKYAGPGLPGANFDGRFPVADVVGSNISIDDVVVEGDPFKNPLPATNKVVATSSNEAALHAAPEPSWIAAVRAVAA